VSCRGKLIIIIIYDHKLTCDEEKRARSKDSMSAWLRSGSMATTAARPVSSEMRSDGAASTFCEKKRRGLKVPCSY